MDEFDEALLKKLSNELNLEKDTSFNVFDDPPNQISIASCACSLSTPPNHNQIISLEHEFGCNIFILKSSTIELLKNPKVQKLAVFDLDSTLLQIEVIDELAKRIPGAAETVAQITLEAMDGKIDFIESIERRAELLEGLDIEQEWRRIKLTANFTLGAKELFDEVLNESMGWKTAIISGGFLPIAKWTKDSLGLTCAFANNLEVNPSSGLLTGKLDGAIIDAMGKGNYLAKLRGMFDAQVTVAVGDGANDLVMINKADIGIAFNAKPLVQKEAPFRLNHERISLLKYILK